MASTPEEIAADVQALRAAFRRGVTRDIKARQQQLRNLQQMLIDGTQDLIEAQWKDVRKNFVEVSVTEVGGVVGEIQEHLANGEKWCAPEPVPTNDMNQPAKSFVYRDSLGVVCIIGTWNYPSQLTFTPLVGAISAGNTVLLRLPGEDTCVHTTEVMKRLLDKYIDKDFVRVVVGGLDATRAMLTQKFDLIFATGGPFLGKMVAEAAAKTLTPTVLELGGKSPSIVDETCDIEVSARRIVNTSFMNAGQTCIRPDYVMVSSQIGDAFVAALEQTIEAFFGKNQQESDSYGRIVNDRCFARVADLIRKDTSHITFGGQMDAADRFIAPTLLNFKRDFKAFDSCATMSQEIFGPALPIYYYESLDEAIEYVNDHEKPLSLYLYSSNADTHQRLLLETSSGGVCVNDSIMQVTNPNLPFGGVGASGMGNYHGKYSIETFTHQKAVLIRETSVDPLQRYPPFPKPPQARN